MKRLASLFLLLIFLLMGCGSTGEEVDYSHYLAKEEGNYGLYVVFDSVENEITSEVLKENNIDNVRRFSGATSIESAALSEVEEVPTYLVFDTEGKVFETNDRNELFQFLQDE